jgi:hypothetical protein
MEVPNNKQTKDSAEQVTGLIDAQSIAEVVYDENSSWISRIEAAWSAWNYSNVLVFSKSIQSQMQRRFKLY